MMIEPAAVVPFVSGATSILDLGSGAGLPGVVIAAMAPTTNVTLLEPKERRVQWLDEVVRCQVGQVQRKAEDRWVSW
jgi:16S rRNA (guanine527-N7)-methyltransferase